MSDSKVIVAIVTNDLAKFKAAWNPDRGNRISPNRDGFYTIHYLIHRHCLDMLEYILENGADPNLKTDKVGNTPLRYLIYSVAASETGMVRLLMKHGANPYIKNNSNRDVFVPALNPSDRELDCLESYLVVELVTGEADNLPLDMWREVKSYLYKL